MKEILIGEFDLGVRRVVVIGEPDGLGGSFESARTKHGKAEIRVGLAYGRWHETLAILLHEALELSASDLGVRYKPVPDYADASDTYFFAMDHAKFSEVAARVGWFAADCVPNLATAYNRVHRPIKRKRK